MRPPQPTPVGEQHGFWQPPQRLEQEPHPEQQLPPAFSTQLGYRKY
jgi:hypothetical protein